MNKNTSPLDIHGISIHSCMFQSIIKDRRWIARSGRAGGDVTHLLMDGGILAVPDDEAGLFLNVYFSHVCVKQESLSVVEKRTPVFRLFFDLDIRINEEDDHGRHQLLKTVARHIWDFVVHQFFVLETSDDSSCSSNNAVKDRMIVCTAPTKVEREGVIKVGCHLHFPNVFVNSPIALKCREGLLTYLASIDLMSTDTASCLPHCTSSQSVTQRDESSETATDSHDSDFITPLNAWSDIVDDTVYRGSGLRMVWSHKGRDEARPYAPSFEMDSMNGWSKVECGRNQNLVMKREYVHDCSIRSPTSGTLTPCRHGEHLLADSVYNHHDGGTLVPGRSSSIAIYDEAIGHIRKALPEPYRTISFVRAFVTDHAVYLKSTSRYCLNVRREHRTSTIYVSVTRQGMTVRCYSRKDEYGCSRFSGPLIALPQAVLKIFFPDIADTVSTGNPFFESTKKRKKNAFALLDTNPLFCKK